MALPAGVAVFTLTFGVAGVLGEDEPLGMRVTAVAATNAIWAATGRPFLYKAQTQEAAVGDSGAITLISPDQDGFVNAFGQAVRNWTYGLTIEYLDAAGTVIASADKNFAYLASMGSSIDLDLTVPVTTSAGVVVDIPGGGGGGGYDGGTVYDPTDTGSYSLLLENGNVLTTEAGDVLTIA